MMRVAIQGEPGAFSHAAALRFGGSDIDLLPCRSFDDLFAAVAAGHADAGAVPVENTLAGAVQRSLDLLAAHDLYVTAELRLPIHLCLAAPPGRSLDEVRTVASHPVALEQCRRLFRSRPGLTAVPVYDTAGSIRDLMSGAGAYDAAVGSALAADLYEAEILLDGIHDHDHNYTRFFFVRPQPAPEPPPRSAKMSICFALSHRPGALHTALGVLAGAGADLTQIVSRPIEGRPWEYRFFVDVTGLDAGARTQCLEALGQVCADVRVLGVYSGAERAAVEAGVGS